MGLCDSEEKVMQQFFTDPSRIKDHQIIIQGTDVNHMKNVLRIKPGEDIRVSDGCGKTYLCCVNRYEEACAVVDIFRELDADTELPSRLYLFQGLPKGDKMDWIVQKAVELGVYSVIPFEAKRSVVRLDAKKAAKKQSRWQAIAKGAAEQSGRGRIPEISCPVSFAGALEMAKDMDIVLIPYELEEGMDRTAGAVESIRPGQSVGIFIGPEGGFEESEVELAGRAGAVPVSLGRRILRTETAGLAVLSILMYHLESGGHTVIKRDV